MLFSRFEWDGCKAETNLYKHGVSFREAATAFDDPFARIIGDLDHSDREERFVLLGMSLKANLLVVCHCYRNQDQAIRLISARRATKNEASAYWRFRNER